MAFADRVIQVAYLLVPFGFLSYGALHRGHHYAFMFAALAILGAQVRDKWLRIAVLYACLWGLWLFINYMLTDNIFSRTKALEVAKLGQSHILWMIVAIGIYLGVARTGGKPAESYYPWICAGALIQMLIAFIQLTGFRPNVWFCDWAFPALGGTVHHQDLPDTAMTGTLFCNNFLAAYMAISAPFFLYFFRHLRGIGHLLLRVFPLIMIVVILYITRSTTAVAAAIVGVLVYYADSKRLLGWSQDWRWMRLLCRVRLIYIAAFFGIILGAWYVLAVDAPFWKDPVRFPAWGLAFKAITQSWGTIIFGLGPGASNTWGFNAPIHNEWLTVWHYYGLIGLALVVGCAVRGILIGSRPLRASLAAACVNMLGNLPMHLAPSAFLVLIILGLIEREQWQTS